VDAVRNEFAKVKPQTAVVREDEPDDSILAGEAEAEAPPSPLEFHLLKLLLMHDDLAATAAAYLDINWILHPYIQEIIDRRLAAQEHKTWQSLAEFLDTFESNKIRNLISEATLKADFPPTIFSKEARIIPNPETELSVAVLKLRNHFLDRQIATLTQKISQPETADAQRLVWLHEQQQLKQLKRSPLAPLEK